MFSRLRQQWQAFKTKPSGERFVATYREHRQARPAAWIGWVCWIVGLLLTLVGLVLMPAPGPGTLIVLLGLSLIARESLSLARVLDAGERRLRPLLMRLRQWWRRRRS